MSSSHYGPIANEPKTNCARSGPPNSYVLPTRDSYLSHTPYLGDMSRNISTARVMSSQGQDCDTKMAATPPSSYFLDAISAGQYPQQPSQNERGSVESQITGGCSDIMSNAHNQQGGWPKEFCPNVQPYNLDSINSSSCLQHQYESDVEATEQEPTGYYYGYENSQMVEIREDYSDRSVVAPKAGPTHAFDYTHVSGLIRSQ